MEEGADTGLVYTLALNGLPKLLGLSQKGATSTRKAGNTAMHYRSLQLMEVKRSFGCSFVNMERFYMNVGKRVLYLIQTKRCRLELLRYLSLYLEHRDGGLVVSVD